MVRRLKVLIQSNITEFKEAIHRSSKMEFLEHGKKKPIVKVENLSNLDQMIRSGGFQRNLKSETQSADSCLKPRCEGNGKQRICLHWHLASRLEMKLEIHRVGEEESGWEEFCDFEPCLKKKLRNIRKCLA
ncbi:hypothetical protein AVEN_162418-1 [Araneus ventricosus]|uniref:Uncharacterized protein n=1 Tax=Araneus ventricosus TaxID=182803 RepID=A0A4Y2JJE4_ARAVE|nr:hypothetical protein AVEN_162418-1 [Araneus ventricosus]